MSYANFAASAQSALENVIIEFIEELKESTGLDNLAIAGGVALNCSANGKVERSQRTDPDECCDTATAVRNVVFDFIGNPGADHQRGHQKYRKACDQKLTPQASLRERLDIHS